MTAWISSAGRGKPRLVLRLARALQPLGRALPRVSFIPQGEEDARLAEIERVAREMPRAGGC